MSYGGVKGMAMEELLGNRSRMRILKLLYAVGELNVSEIARRLGVNYSEAKKHLQILEDAGLLVHKTFGRIRLYRLNEASKKVKAIKNFIEAWEKSEMCSSS
ncbi:winged helix-turn-helix transcriptional regulator [Candidatus Bathyarchaeota archaeon]|nr:winged helix-turn-helix transcriptional regulator [Candidatus Bathyarchaeota archaeon]